MCSTEPATKHCSAVSAGVSVPNVAVASKPRWAMAAPASVEMFPCSAPDRYARGCVVQRDRQAYAGRSGGGDGRAVQQRMRREPEQRCYAYPPVAAAVVRRVGEHRAEQGYRDGVDAEVLYALRHHLKQHHPGGYDRHPGV